MDYIIAFLIGGLICGLGQLILDLTTLTPGHMLVMFTVLGAIAGGFGVYQPFLEFAKAGALVPVTGFGASIAKGSLLEAERSGIIGLFTGAFEFTGQGLAVAVFFSAIFALFFSPRS
ncbi:MAG TPA: SpoVA/SpoVAEb family sporulation membrane protein [Bacillota bacterium]|nr:SpoVA/SpoVAEb family sporulation membrane protein [Bacillota bacterium]